jgi:hypothetical protein
MTKPKPSQPSKTQTSLYRRVYVLWLIDSGINSVPLITEATGMPRRTAQDIINAIHELGVTFDNAGGTFTITSWGMIERRWLDANIVHVRVMLGYPKLSKANEPS